MESISVVLPVRNGEAFLSRILPIIMGNISESDEILVVNDHSNDNTLKILQEFAASNKSIRILSSGAEGLVEALNLGVENAKNNWIARFDVDDLYPDYRLSVQRNYLTDRVAVIFSDYKVQSDAGCDLGTIPSAITASGTLLSLVSSNRTAHPSALFNREMFLKAGGYLRDEFPAEDLGLWFRMAKFGELVSVPDVLLHYTMHKNSISSTRNLLMRQKREEILRKYRFSSSQLLFINDNLEHTMKIYSNESDRTLRTFLLGLDYFSLRKIGCTPNNHLSNTFRILWTAFWHPDFGIVFFRAARMKNLRRRFRLES